MAQSAPPLAPVAWPEMSALWWTLCLKKAAFKAADGSILEEAMNERVAAKGELNGSALDGAVGGSSSCLQA